MAFIRLGLPLRHAERPYNPRVGNRALALLLIPFLFGACDKSSATKRTPQADFSEDAVAARVELLRADVEAELGDTIGSVDVTISTPKDMAKLLQPELERTYSEIEGGLRGATLKKQCELEAQAYSSALLAKVAMTGAALHVCPENFKRIADITPEWAGIQSPDGLDIILIHELVHVWQERRYKLETFIGTPRSLDALLARSAVLEGHAQLVTRAVAQRRGISEAFELLERTQTEVPDSTTDPAARQQMQLTQAVTSFTYAQGLRLWDEVIAELGRPAAVELLFTEPPSSTRAVEREGQYLHPTPEPEVDLDRAIRQLRRYLGEFEKQPPQVVPMMHGALRVALSAGGPVAQRAIDDVVRGAGVIGARHIVGVVLCRSPRAARALMEASLIDARARVKLFADGATTLRIVSEEDVAGVAGKFLQLRVESGGNTIKLKRGLFADGYIFVDVVAPDGDRERMVRMLPRLASLLAKPSPWSGMERAQAIAEMQTSLSHADVTVRWRAVRNLARLIEARPDLETALLGAAADADPGVRLVVMRAMAAAGHDLVRFAKDHDWEVREAYCRLRAEDDDPKPKRIEMLKPFLTDESHLVQLAACEALEELDAEKDISFDAIETLFASPDGRVREAALGLIHYSVKGTRIADLMLRALDDEETNVRARAARRVDKYVSASGRAVPKLIGLLDDKSVRVQLAALNGLGDYGAGAKESVGRIIPMLDDPKLRDAAADALAEMGSVAGAAKPALVRGLNSEDRRFAFKAAEALWKLRYPRLKLLPVLADTLKNGSRWDRGDAATLLAKIGEPARGYIPEIIELLDSDQEYVRRDAIQALGEFGPAAKAALPKLRTMLKTLPNGVDSGLGLGGGELRATTVETAIKKIEG